jgi:polyhydroxybutyrate depolymerase
MLRRLKLGQRSWVAQTLAVVILLGLSARPAGADPSDTGNLTPDDYDFSLTHAGRVRAYLLHVPPQAADKKPLAVVLNFHGGGGTAKGQKEWSGLDAVADREGFLAVYPDGTERFGRHLLTWNAGTCCGYARTNAVDDVGFVIALLADLATRTLVDHTR